MSRAPHLPSWIVNRSTRGSLPRLNLRELWSYREVGFILAERDVKVRYKQTFLGIAWALLQPLLAMVVFTVALGRFDGLASEGLPYSAFVVAGLAVWFPLSTAVSGAAESLVSAPELVTKAYFPRLLAPLGAVLAAVVDLAIALAVAQVVAVAAGVPLEGSAALLPVCMLAVAVVSLALGLWLAALNVLYRDVRYAFPFVMQLLLFASPIFYAGPGDDADWGWLFAVNPVAGVTDGVRAAMLGTSLDGTHVLVSCVSAAILLAGGVVFFRWTERTFADRI